MTLKEENLSYPSNLQGMISCSNIKLMFLSRWKLTYNWHIFNQVSQSHCNVCPAFGFWLVLIISLHIPNI